jgi:hypothetical protein
MTIPSPLVSDAASDLTNSVSGSISVSETNEMVSAVPAKEKGGTMRRNALAWNEIWQFYHLYNEKQFSKSNFTVSCLLNIMMSWFLLEKLYK